jgi:hypothetical protein
MLISQATTFVVRQSVAGFARGPASRPVVAGRPTGWGMARGQRIRPPPGHVAVVTGATGGMGAVAARRPAGDGAAVAISERRGDRLKRLTADIGDRVLQRSTSPIDQPSVGSGGDDVPGVVALGVLATRERISPGSLGVCRPFRSQ